MFSYDTLNCPAAYPDACCGFLPGLSAGAIGCLLGLFSDVSQDTAVYVKYMSVYEVGSIGCQEYGRSHQIFGSSPTGSRSLGYDKGIERMTGTVGLSFTQRSRLRSSDITRADTVASGARAETSVKSTGVS